MPPRFIKPPPSPPPENFIVIMSDNAYIRQHIVSMAYVTGEVCGIHRPRVLLAAANENVMLAPHWWHLVAVAPTNVPQAGHSFGRCCFGSDWNIPGIWLRQRSNL